LPAVTVLTQIAASSDEIVGASASVRATRKMIDRVAGSAAVLIAGASGTGKTFVAHAIHRHGKRPDKPFVALNCAAVPSELLEGILFGYVRGGATATVSGHPGSFRQADGGMLFIDEIDAMSLAVQSKLLQALQDRTITPLGGKPVTVDVRVIAATSHDLDLAVAQGHFREDLFYWRNLALVHLPPLCERLADILPLAEHFLALVAGKKPPKRLSPEAAQHLLAYDWPGNVRELRNATERAAALVRQPVLNAAAFDFLAVNRPELEPGWLANDLPTAVACLETRMIRQGLAACGGNRSEAAHRLGITRQLLYTKMQRYGLDAPVILTNDVPNAVDMSGSSRLHPT
jgi:DNA-binding NtrC family response regulator